MYRCIGCDSPAQATCDCAKQEAQQQYDPWGWEEEEHKLDINSGRTVSRKEYEEAAVA